MNQQVSAAFKKLFFGKRTGVLTCYAAESQRAVYFQSGFVVSASSSLKSDRLGEVMMQHGRITEEQFRDASHFIKSGWRLGEILAELKVIDEGEIEQFVRLQLMEITCAQLLNPPKRLAFSPLSDVDQTLSAPLSVADILMEAARRSPDSERVVSSLREDTRSLGFPRDSMKRFQDLNLLPEEAFVLSRVDGVQTAADIFALSPLPEEQTARILFGLLEAEVLEPAGSAEAEPEPEGASSSPSLPSSPERPDAPALPPSAAAPPSAAPPRRAKLTKRTPTPDEARKDLEVDTSQTLRRGEQREVERASIERLYQEIQFQDHWQVLGIDSDSDPDDVKRAFFTGAKRYHPDKFRHITDPEFQEKLSFIFQRINEAYETLSSTDAKTRYQELQEKEADYEESKQDPGPGSHSSSAQARTSQAQELFQRAKRAFDTEDYWSCIELTRECVELAPEEAAYYHLLGLALSQNPKWRQDAEKNLNIAANLDPFRAIYVLDLAKIYERAGLHLRAQRTLERTQAIDPSVESLQ